MITGKGKSTIEIPHRPGHGEYREGQGGGAAQGGWRRALYSCGLYVLGIFMRGSTAACAVAIARELGASPVSQGAILVVVIVSLPRSIGWLVGAAGK